MTRPSKLATCLTHQNNLKTLFTLFLALHFCQCYQYSRESSMAPTIPVEPPSANTATTTCENERAKHYPRREQARLWEYRVAAFFAFPLGWQRGTLKAKTLSVPSPPIASNTLLCCPGGGCYWEAAGPASGKTGHTEMAAPSLACRAAETCQDVSQHTACRASPLCRATSQKKREQKKKRIRI